MTTQERPDEQDDWFSSWSRTFWLFVLLGLFILMIYNSKIALLWGGQHNPEVARSCGIWFFIIGVVISLADDSRPGEAPAP